MQSRLNIFVLAVAIIALGVAAYALTQVPSDPGDNAGPSTPDSGALADVETRLAALEAAWLRESDRPVPGTTLRERMDELERRMAAMAGGRAEALPPTTILPASTESEPEAAAGEPDADEVDRFKKVQAAAAKLERTKRSRAQIDRALKDLQISLTDRQRDQLVEAWSGFGKRRDEIWGEAKRSGAAQGTDVDWGVIIADTTRLIEREFTERISGFIPGSDAERIAADLNNPGK